MNKKLRTFVYPVCAFIVLLLLWQVCVMLSTSEIAFPTPVAVFKEFFYILTHKVGNYYTVVGHVLWSLSRVLVGFSIAAVFGIIIAISGCYHGIHCGRSAQAVGEATTTAVVHAIVGIIVATAIITVICNVLGV